MEMTQYVKYTDSRYLDRKEFVKYHAFRELLELPCQLLDWRTAVSAGGFNCAWKSRVACWEPICTKSSDCYSHSLCYQVILEYQRRFKMPVPRDMIRHDNLVEKNRIIDAISRFQDNCTSVTRLIFLYNIA